MIPKYSLLLLVLTISQAFALESRQSNMNCPICTTAGNILNFNCNTNATSLCCSSTTRSQVQDCVNCSTGIDADSTVQSLIDGYSKSCPNSSTMTKPGVSAATGVSKVSSGTSDKGKRVAVGAICAIVGAALVI